MDLDSASAAFGHAIRALHAGVRVEGASPAIAALFAEGLPAPTPGDAYASVRFHDRLPSVSGATVNASTDEDFVIEAGERIDVYAATERAAAFAAHSLMRRARGGLLPTMRLAAHPICSVRGVKLLLPPADGLGDFKRFIDFLAARRYNTIMLEIGGAMEYRRRPEINRGWIDYCREMREYPGKTHKIQGAYGWMKNSIHADNAGGGVLTQAMVRQLIDHCRHRHMEVIPEVPLLSHCDYLLTRHPELAERREDPYPDTYCPSNPATYELVFDVLEEVIEVFRPRMLNIGHDEYYSIALCERCKGKPAPEIFAGDIRKLHAFLAERGVKTQMWGEKLIAAKFKDGTPLGGAERWGTPATHPAIDLIPRDVEILHWYWGIDRAYESSYLSRGMAMTYGNFEASSFPEWPRRIAQAGVRGIVISNWGATDAITLQRNCILFETALAARLCWDPRLDDGDFDRLRVDVFEELYRGGYDEVAGGPSATPDTAARTLEIVHTTDHHREFTGFVDGNYYRPDDFLLGEHRIVFADGREHREPVIYGSNIGYEGVSWDRLIDKMRDVIAPGRRLHEPAGIALPWRDGATTWYTTRLTLPAPVPPEGVRRIEFVPRAGFKGSVHVRSACPMNTKVHAR